MILERLSISRNESYQPRPNEYKGSARFKGDHGEVEIPLDEELSREILKLVAGSMERAAKALGNALAADIISQVPALEAPRD